MDPVTIASATVALLIELFKRLGGRILDQTGSNLADVAQAKVEALYQRVKIKLADDDYNAGLLKGVEADPNSASRRANLKHALADELEQDPVFKAALERLLIEAQGADADFSVEAYDSGATAGRDFHQIARESGTNIGRDQVNFAPPPSRPTWIRPQP